MKLPLSEADKLIRLIRWIIEGICLGLLIVVIVELYQTFGSVSP